MDSGHGPSDVRRNGKANDHRGPTPGLALNDKLAARRQCRIRRLRLLSANSRTTPLLPDLATGELSERKFSRWLEPSADRALPPGGRAELRPNEVHVLDDIRTRLGRMRHDWIETAGANQRIELIEETSGDATRRVEILLAIHLVELRDERVQSLADPIHSSAIHRRTGFVERLVQLARDLAHRGQRTMRGCGQRDRAGRSLRDTVEGCRSGGARARDGRAQLNVIRPEHPRISPDGGWVSYIDRSTYDVWVHSLRDSSTLMVSTATSLDSPAVWGPNSRTLYYRSAEGVSVIELATTPVLSVVRRRSIRAMPVSLAFDLARDGKTFAMLTPAQSVGVGVVEVDWLTEARREWSAKPKK